MPVIHREAKKVLYRSLDDVEVDFIAAIFPGRFQAANIVNVVALTP